MRAWWGSRSYPSGEPLLGAPCPQLWLRCIDRLPAHLPALLLPLPSCAACRLGLGLLGLGSVSDYVVKHAGCNVRNALRFYVSSFPVRALFPIGLMVLVLG